MAETTSKLNIPHVRLWIAALRSGEFKQTEGALRVSNGESKHCCLGVGCELYSQEVGGFFDDNNSFIADFSPNKSKNWNLTYDWKFQPIEDALAWTPPVREWFGLSPMAENTLSSINDNTKAGFLRIADILSKAITLQRKTNTPVPDEWWNERAADMERKYPYAAMITDY